MRRTWMLAAVAAAGAVVAGPAAAAWADQSAQETINQLQQQGYTVNIDRIGTGPMSQCVVTSVRNPQEVTQTFAVGKGEDREFITVVVSRSITVSLNCSR